MLYNTIVLFLINKKIMEVRTTTSIKLNPVVKENTKAIFNELGLTMSDAVNIFLKQVELQGGLPFEVKIPNKETLKAIKEARAGINVVEFNIEDFKR
jgi:DNA-damage-inducible protein J